MSETKLYSSNERRFTLVSYNYAHGLLLLRSGRNGAHKTRIDIHFTDVVAIVSRTHMENLEIYEKDSTLALESEINPNDIIEPGHRMFSLHFEGGSGYIIAGNIAMHEDEKQFGEPSFFIDKLPLPDTYNRQ